MSAIRVVIVDDHPTTRAGLRSVLSAAADIDVVGEAGSGAEALLVAEELRPDVLILDVGLPDMPGSEVARRLQASASPVDVLGFSGHDEAEEIDDMLSAGAAGYLVKDDASSLADHIRGIVRGEIRLSHRITAKAVRPRKEHPPRRVRGYAALTEREVEILGLVARGHDKGEIAELLQMSEGTVKNHVTRLYEKSGTRTMQKLMAWGLQHGYEARASGPAL